MKSGIYGIVNLTNGKIYVGQAKSFNRRWNAHDGKLRNGDHNSPYLQSSYDKYGNENFIRIILEYVIVDKDLLTLREQHWMNKLQSANREFGYNYAPAAGSLLGFKPSEKTLAKLAERSAKLKGIKRSPEICEKIGAANRGSKRSPESIEKMRQAKLGTTQSAETKAKRSASMMGNQNAAGVKQSAEVIAHRTSFMLGVPRTPETIAKIAKANTGKVRSAETREKQRIAALKRWGKLPA